LFIAPLGRDTTVDLKSNWNSPSFQGAWLPSQRTVNVNGFEAAWTIPYLGRNYPQSWNSEKLMKEKIAASQFGVNLIAAVDKYRMAERSVKYAGLFILLTFAAIWLIEILVKFRVHFLQYLLLGFALCIFYLLELSLSEHMRFTAAYAIAALAIIVMITAYGKVMLKTFKKAAIVGSIVIALYTYLYIILCNEDYALLMGSIGLFVILGLIMFLTRRVNWSDANA
jgi:inner membrane protein